MFPKMISTLFILANLWTTTEEGLVDGVLFCTSQLSTLFEWFLLCAFLAAFVTALCGADDDKEGKESKEEVGDLEDENEKTAQDMNGNKIRRRPASLREIWEENEEGLEFSGNFLDNMISNEEDEDLDIGDNGLDDPISLQTIPSDSKEATFTDAIAETLVRDLLKNSDNDDIERVLDGQEKKLRPNAFSGFWRQLPGKGDTKKVRNIWNLEDDLDLKDEDRTTLENAGESDKKRDSLQLPKEYWLSDSLQELAKTWTLEKLMDENSKTDVTPTILRDLKEDEHGNHSSHLSKWTPPKETGLRFQISESCVLNNPWSEEMRRSKPTLSERSHLSIQRPLGLDFEILESPTMGSFSPSCCPGLGNLPKPDSFNSNISNTLNENLELLGVWVGSEDNFLQIQVPLVEEFPNKKESFQKLAATEGFATADSFFPQAQAPLEDFFSQTGIPLLEDYTNYTNNHFASFQEEKEQHRDVLQRYN